jgi:hypothetical protein
LFSLPRLAGFSFCRSNGIWKIPEQSFCSALGYWGYLAAASPTGETRSRFVPAVGVLAIVLFAGLVLVPRSFGLAPASFGALLATALGLAVGATLASKKKAVPNAAQ